MIKIIMIFDQVQSGQGTKEDRMIPLNATKEVIGPAVMMKSFLREIDGQVVATLVSGTGTYEADPAETGRKLCAMVQKLKPDVVICGPSFNYADYSRLCAEVAERISRETKIPALAAMSADNEEIISGYKDKICIVKTPKKGGAGLNDALKNICQTAAKLAQGIDVEKGNVCY